MKTKVFKIIVVILNIFLLTGCDLFHEHTYKKATCTRPKTCIECGETKGKALGHDYEDATCTEKKTCKVCGHTEGEYLGHTTDIGKCTRCNKHVNLSLVTKDIANEVTQITTAINSANDYVNKLNYSSIGDSYINFVMVYNIIAPTKQHLNTIVDLCNDVEGLKNLKIKTEQTLKSFPNEINVEDSNKLMMFLDEYKTYSKSCQELSNEYQKIMKLYEE